MRLGRGRAPLPRIEGRGMARNPTPRNVRGIASSIQVSRMGLAMMDHTGNDGVNSSCGKV
jgi:hypothetical protein